MGSYTHTHPQQQQRRGRKSPLASRGGPPLPLPLPSFVDTLGSLLQPSTSTLTPEPPTPLCNFQEVESDNVFDDLFSDDFIDTFLFSGECEECV